MLQTNSRHTCITDDGGTPNRKCAACDDEKVARHVYVGIDPGASGGIAMLSTDGIVELFEKMPATDADKLVLLRRWNAYGHSVSAVLEYVRAMPAQGVSSSFKFGANYGSLRMALAAVEIPYVEATPGSWQRALQCLSKGDKNITKGMAQQLFPGIASKITHATADAILIAEYARRLGLSRAVVKVGKVSDF